MPQAPGRVRPRRESKGKTFASCPAQEMCPRGLASCVQGPRGQDGGCRQQRRLGQARGARGAPGLRPVAEKSSGPDKELVCDELTVPSQGWLLPISTGHPTPTPAPAGRAHSDSADYQLHCPLGAWTGEKAARGQAGLYPEGAAERFRRGFGESTHAQHAPPQLGSLQDTPAPRSCCMTAPMSVTRLSWPALRWGARGGRPCMTSWCEKS